MHIKYQLPYLSILFHIPVGPYRHSTVWQSLRQEGRLYLPQHHYLKFLFTFRLQTSFYRIHHIAVYVRFYFQSADPKTIGYINGVVLAAFSHYILR